MSYQLPYTDSVNIAVDSQFLANHSDPEEHNYAFSYTITITNNSEHALQLKSRSWLITDANGDTSTVEGAGVVGQQPRLTPGQSFTYTSGCVLKTPLGTMQGHYVFESDDGQACKAPIDVFRLAQPNILHWET